MLDEEIISQIKNIIKDDSIIVSCSFPPNYLLPFLDEKEILYIYKLVIKIIAYLIFYITMRYKNSLIFLIFINYRKN